jgi:hypothetical protein
LFKGTLRAVPDISSLVTSKSAAIVTICFVTDSGLGVVVIDIGLGVGLHGPRATL